MGYQVSTMQRRHSCKGHSGPSTRSRAYRSTWRWSNTGVGLVACDASGMLTLISPTLQELFGIEPTSRSPSRSTWSGSGSSAADGETPLPTDEVPLVRARRGEFVRDALVTHAPLRRRSWCTCKCNAVPLRDDDGPRHGAIALVQDVTAETQAALRAEELQQAAGRDDQPRVPYAAGRAARPRRADPRPPRPSRRPRPGAGRLAGRHRAVRLAAARPGPGGRGAGQRERTEPAEEPEPTRPTARPGQCARLTACHTRAELGAGWARSTVSSCGHSAGRGTDRTVRLSVGIRATSAHSPASTAIAAGPPSTASSPPPRTGASGRVDQPRNWPGRLDPADQLGRGDRHLVGADAGVAGRVEEDAGRQRDHHHRRVVPEDQRHQQRHEAPRHDDGEDAGGGALDDARGGHRAEDPADAGGGLDQADRPRREAGLDQPQRRPRRRAR